MDRYTVSCNNLQNLSNRVCPPNKAEDLNLGAFYMVTEICNSDQKWSNDKYQCEYKNPKKHNMCKNIIFGTLLHVAVKMVNIRNYHWQFSYHV